MNLKQFLEKICRDWKPKVVCFSMALLLYVSYTTTIMDKKTLTLPLDIVSEGTMTAEADVEHKQYVLVTLSGRSEQIATITENDLKVYCDISSQPKEGRYDFNVLVHPTERLLLMEPLEIKTTPEKVSLSIEENIFKYIPISPSISGEPAYGYQITEKYVEPSTIKVTGPKSLVESIDAIYTEKIDIAGITQTSIQDTVVVSPSKLVHLEKLNAPRVTVKLQASGMIKDFKGLSVSCISLKDNLEITNLPFYVDVTLEGDLLDVENLKSTNIKAIADCSEIADSGLYVVPIKINIPKGLQLDYQSLSSVNVSVRRIEEAPAEDAEAAPVTETSEADN